MNPTLRDVIRDAIDRQNDAVSPPATLAETVLDRHRRQVTRRSVLGGAAAVAGTAVAAPLLVRWRRESTATPWPGRNLVVTAMGPVRVGDHDGMLLLDNRTGEYEEVPDVAVPSPDGRLVVVQSPWTGAYPRIGEPPPRFGVLDRDTGRMRWDDPKSGWPGRSASWASDASRFVLTTWPDKFLADPVKPASAVVFDAATGASLEVAVPDSTAMMQYGESFVWVPGADRLMATVIGVVDPATGGVGVAGVAEFDLAGRHLRTVPVRGTLTTNAQFSPDAGRIALLGSDGAGHVARIVDRVTGAATGETALPAGTRQIVGWYDEDHLVVAAYLPPGRPPMYDLTVVRLTDGRVVHRHPLPRTGEHYWYIFVTPVDDLPDAVRRHTF